VCDAVVVQRARFEEVLDGRLDFLGRVLAIEQPRTEGRDGQLAAGQQAEAVEVGGRQGVSLRTG
jgi:hypothetical protein